tara:strand:- start:1161 stop:1916 length:756 start_codon:yes stop_codon:yes gene_type:complete
MIFYGTSWINMIERLALFILKIVKYYRYNTRVYSYPKKAYQRFCEDEMEDSYQNFKKYFYTSLIMKQKYLKPWVIKRSLENDQDPNNFYLEFGVHLGRSIKVFSEFLKNKNNGKDRLIYGFDNFTGLKEDWHGTSGALHLDEKEKLPKVNRNVILIKGWIQDTLEKFLSENNVSRISFINIDVDTYETTKYILPLIKPYLFSGSIIIFDEIYNFPGWKVGEYKALIEEFKDEEYKFIAFSDDGKQAAIEII